MNSLSVLSLSDTRIHFKFYISCFNLRWVYTLYRQFTMNVLFIKWIHYELTLFFVVYYKFTLFFSWISYDSTIKYADQLFILYRLRLFTMNSFSDSRIQFEFTIFDANSLCTRSLCRVFSMSSLSIMQMHYKFIIFFANSFWIDYFPRIYYEFTIFIANSISVT